MPFGGRWRCCSARADRSGTAWPDWWWALVACVGRRRRLAVSPAVPARPCARARRSAADRRATGSRLRTTVDAPAPWLTALTFAVYSAQWMARDRLPPAIYAGAGVQAGLERGASPRIGRREMNIVGNVGGAFWLAARHRARAAAAAGLPGDGAGRRRGLRRLDCGAGRRCPRACPPALRYVAVCAFSLGGGMAPADAVPARRAAWRPAPPRCRPRSG